MQAQMRSRTPLKGMTCKDLATAAREREREMGMFFVDSIGGRRRSSIFSKNPTAAMERSIPMGVWGQVLGRE